MGEPHLNRAYLEMARQLLAAGAVVAYGGDHREKGFTQQLFELVRTYDQPDQKVDERTENYLAWPMHLNLSDDRRVDLLDVAILKELPLPQEVADEFGIDPTQFLPPNSTQNRYVWTRCLTDMRERMNKDIHARVLLGGRMTGYKGAYPGIIQEAHLTLRDGKPTYLLGGFGGAARAAIDALLGETPESLTAEYQRKDVEYANMMDFYNQRHPDASVDYEALAADFQTAGITGLNNGLDEDENRRLFQTQDVDEMVALVLRGLSRV
jgi:hypothetical protein